MASSMMYTVCQTGSDKGLRCAQSWDSCRCAQRQSWKWLLSNGLGHLMTLYEVASEIGSRLQRIFLRDKDGHRPLYGGAKLFQEDPHWRDLILFYEYFNGDNGAGIGASHQTGWTGLVSRLLELYADTSGEQILEAGRQAPAKIAASLYPGGPGP